MINLYPTFSNSLADLNLSPKICLVKSGRKTTRAEWRGPERRYERRKGREYRGEGEGELGGRNNPVTESRISDFWGLHRANFCTGSLRCYRKFRDPARNGMLNHVDQRPDVGRGFLEVSPPPPLPHFGINIFTFVNLLTNRTCG